MRYPTGDAAVGKSSLLIRLTDQRFLANPDPTVRSSFSTLCYHISCFCSSDTAPSLGCTVILPSVGLQCSTRMAFSHFNGVRGVLTHRVYPLARSGIWLEAHNNSRGEQSCQTTMSVFPLHITYFSAVFVERAAAIGDFNLAIN